MLGIEKNEVEIKGGIEVFSYEALEILKEIVKKKKMDTPISARNQRAKLYMKRAQGRAKAIILATGQIFQIYQIIHAGSPKFFLSQAFRKQFCISEPTGDPVSWR